MKLKISNEQEVYRIDIYDEISHDTTDFWTGEEYVNLHSIQDKLEEADGKPLEVHINSNGGEVFEGLAIYNVIKNYRGQKVTIVDGLAASIASVIALAGDVVKMNAASMLMIHNASTFCYGNADDMEEVAKVLRQVSSVIRDVYVSKTKQSPEEIDRLMKAETYLNAQDALNYGFIDEIIEEDVDNQLTDVAKQELNNRLQATIKSLNQLRLVNIGTDEYSVSKDENEVEIKEEPKRVKNKAIRNWLEKEIK